MSNIKNLTHIGSHLTCDLEIDHSDHQFYLANGVLTSNSHATAYAIDSYMCAWLLTHYEQEWLCSYLESMSNSPDNRAQAFGEIKSMGYKIIPIDINYAGKEWIIVSGKRFMPSFLSCKGIGEAAIDEIESFRPYSSIEDFLWNEDGTWKHSKLNRKAIDALIKIGALASLNCVGPNNVFNSWHHAHEVIVNNMDLIKKTSKKDPHAGRKVFYELVRESSSTIQEWTRRELAEFNSDIFGTLDVLNMINPAVIAKLEEKDVIPIDELAQGSSAICWFCAQSSVLKKTKNDRTYAQVQALGPTGKVVRLNVWGSNKKYENYELYVAAIERDDFGCSTSIQKLKILE